MPFFSYLKAFLINCKYCNIFVASFMIIIIFVHSSVNWNVANGNLVVTNSLLVQDNFML